VSRTARLLELLVRVQTKPRFTAAELAEEFGVSRRTMLRDLGALSERAFRCVRRRGREVGSLSRGAAGGSLRL
jgi:predicted DNA-binding transcriptional regulator YafY